MTIPTFSPCLIVANSLLCESSVKMIDLLLEANKHYCMMMSTQLKDPLRIPTASRFLDFKFPRLPISRAWSKSPNSVFVYVLNQIFPQQLNIRWHIYYSVYPKLYLRVDDGIVGIVEDRATDNDDLLRLKELIYQCRNHVFYKCAGEKEVVDLGGDAFWNDTSEDDIRREILEGNLHYDAGGKALTLDPNDIHVEKREIHCGRKKDNPVGQMRFLYKSQCGENLKNTINELPIAREVTKFPSDTPKEFVERTIRVFSRSEEKNEFVAHAYENWFAHKQEILAAPNCEFKIFGEQNFEEEDDSQPASQPACLTQDSAMMHSPAAPMAGRKRKDEPTPSPTRARRKIF